MSAHRQPQSPSVDAVALDSRPLPHERLDVFGVAIELVEQVASIRAPRGNAALMDQIRRATQSVALNIAEACGKSGRDRRRFFEIVRGSSLESAAALRILLALRIVDVDAYATGRTLCERAYAMLTRLCRPV